ncbi:MAG: hypothetical protein Q9195_005560 [Heterodermia aff. obscurata]
MGAVKIGQKTSLQPFKKSKVVKDKELLTAVSAIEKNDPVIPGQHTDSTTSSLPASSLVRSSKDQDPGDFQDLGTKAEQESQAARGGPGIEGIPSSLASLTCSAADKKSGKARKRAQARKKKAEKKQAGNKSNQVAPQQCGVEQEFSTACDDEDLPSRPVYNKLRSQTTVDPSKFETEPLQRSSAGFQPRPRMSHAEESSLGSSVTAEAPSFTGPREVPGGEANAQSSRRDEHATTANDAEVDRASERSDSTVTVQAMRVATNVEIAKQASEHVQSSANNVADNKSTVEATNKGTGTLTSMPPALPQSAQAGVEVASRSSQTPVLEASMWAPKQMTLKDLPGLRQSPPTPTWDASGYYTHPIKAGPAGLSLNILHKHAWNGGVKPQPSNNVHPTSRPGGSKDAVTAARPASGQNATLNISERVPSTSPVVIDAKIAGTTEAYVPPHLRISESQTQLLEPKKEQNSATSMVATKANSPAPSFIVPLSPGAESSLNGLSQENHEASACDGGPLTLATTMTSAAINGHGLDDAKHKLAPHLRAPKPRATPVVTESQPMMQNHLNAQNKKVEKDSKKAGMNGVLKPITPNGESKAVSHHKNATIDEKDIGSSTPTFPHDSSNSKMKKKDKQNANAVQGWDNPVETAHALPGWDSKAAELPEDWQNRSRQPIPATERTRILESWAEASESAVHKGSSYVDTALPEFALGTGIIHNGSLSAGLSDQAHFTRRLPNDPLTHARAEQTAQSKIEEHKAKKQEEKTEPQLTKQELRQLRREQRRLDEEYAKIPNPYKPKADIYIRPAQIQDLPQIVEIYNHYVQTSAVALELDPLTRDTWRLRMEDCRSEGYDMYVAVQKAAQGNGRNRRDNCEPIFGFAYAEDQNDKRSSCRFAAMAQVYVSWKHLRIGVGRCLLDRVMAMLNVNHHYKQGVEWVGPPMFKQREVKKVLIEIPYWDNSEEERAIFRMEKNKNTGVMDRVPGWKAQWLEKVQFEYAGTLNELGFKQGPMEKGKTVSIATFILDTWLDISTKRDVQ